MHRVIYINLMTNKTNNSQSIFLFLTYLIIVLAVLPTFKEHGVHIEEKFHRLNGLFWLNYVSQIFSFEKLNLITENKIKLISDYTLSPAGSYMDKYGVILDLPVALIEIIFNIEKIEDIYYLKQFLSFVIFLISSFFFYKILIERFDNFFLAFSGTMLFITSPRIFGDSFLYKDVLFLSFFCISLYFLLKSSENLNIKNILYFSLFTAIAFNLRVFGVFLPVTFFLLLIIKSLSDKKFYNYIKYFLLYLFTLLCLIILLSPYLWSNTLINFLDIFAPLKRASIGGNIKVLFNNNFVPNRIVPETYLFTWILITTPIITLILFLLGYFFYFKRFIIRFINIKEKQPFNDLWRGQNEQKDFIGFFILTSFCLALLIFNSPFYNGWRLVYFINIFIIYFAVYQINCLLILFKKKDLKRKAILYLALVSILHNVVCLFSYHPYQSYYFSELISDNKKNSFEGDYHGLSGKHFFLKLNSEYKKKEMKVAVASHTPLHRSLEGIKFDIRKKFEVIGQNYENADFIYKNNISEVNSNLNKKYNIPTNFVKVYELNINGIKIYEIFKKIE